MPPVQLSIITAIFLNMATGNFFVNTTCGELVPALTQVSPLLASKTIMWVVALGVFLTGILQVYLAVTTVWRKLGTKEFMKEGLSGVLPLLQWLLCFSQVFLSTEWAWKHPALVTILFIPSFCLINSKMIVNSVTNMETDMDSTSFFIWFFLFPINKQNQLLPEWQVAAIVFLITLTTYMVFVVCTIGQITRHLDIYCLSIKPKAPSSQQQQQKSQQQSRP